MGDNRAHSELGASISHRWIECPGSVRLSRGQPNNDNVHAQAGRAAHHVVEQCLTYGQDADRFLGDIIPVPSTTDPEATAEVDEDMVYGAQMFVDYCRNIMTEHRWIEQSFSLEALGRPGMYGTTDFAAYDPRLQALEVVDLKFGQGVVVEVKNNPQLRYYALGAALELGNKFPIDLVKITIIQPRASHPDGFIRSEIIPYTDLLEFAGDLLNAADKTADPDAPLNPGSHCRFCPALAICPAQRKQAQALAQVAFSEMPVAQPPAPETLPDEILGDLLSKTPILVDWVKALGEEAERRLRAGRDVPGMKLVEKRANRKWKDEDATATWLHSQAGLLEEEYLKEPEMKSPAQVEKLLTKDQKKQLAELVEKKSSGYKLAPSSHPSPAIAAGPQDAFAALPPASE